MANREKGQASFEHGKRRYTLVLNMYAWAETQDALAKRGRKVQDRVEIGRRMAAGSTKHVIAMFFGMLQEHHPEIETLAQASALLEEVGSPAVEAMGLAMGLSQADLADAQELLEGAGKDADQADPLDAQDEAATTRDVSTSRRVRSA